MTSGADVLIVSLGSTAGLRAADAQLAGALRRAGARVAVAAARPAKIPLRTMALCDLRDALACRTAAASAIAVGRPRSIIYSTVTAALLWPQAGAIRFDSRAADNRPGRHGVWQRPLERRRLLQSTLLLPWSRSASVDGIVLPVSVDPSGPTGERDITAITYAAHPHKKGLDRVLAAWRAARRPGERLLVAGVERLPEPVEGAEATGMLERAAYRALLRRARVFVCAPRREDHGIAQLEALADGCALVTSAAPGPYAALSIARDLDKRLVVADPRDLPTALRVALDDGVSDYAERAARALAPLRAAAVDRLVCETVLPALLS
ncbi:MAG: glycosyltransferase [Solirubrobacteraceae bacterium]